MKTYIARFVALLVFGAALPTLAQITDATLPENGTTEFVPAPITTLPELDSETATSSGRNLISIALDDVELIDVVRMFSRIASANIIANPEILIARVTVNLEDVEWRPALSSILSMHGLALLERPQGSGVFIVVEQPPDAPVPMTVKTIFLDYTTVDEVRPVVERMMSSGASLSAFPSRNAMVIRDTEANINEIEIVIAQIDIQAKQVVVETQFMELNDSASKQLGIRWDSLNEITFGVQANPLFGTARDNTRIRSREDTLTRSDNLTRTDNSTRTFDMFGDPVDAATSREIGSVASQSRNAGSEVLASTVNQVVTASAAILDVSDFNVVMSALKKTDGVSIVSNPKIIVTSGSTNAFFNVGNQEPIITTETQQGTADNPGTRRTAKLDTTINTDYIKGGYLNTGIRLQVVPTVKTDDLIEAIIAPTLTRKIDDKFVGDDGNSWPELQVKEIRTQFTLQSGQTVAIGGLTDTRDSKKTSKIPLLGDIPIIGKYLFSHSSDIRNQEETIIFVTLSLVDPMQTKRAEGIPQRAELTYKREIRDKIRQLELQQELEDLRKAARKIEEQFERRSIQVDDSVTAEP
ncbi:MAG: type II secretion system protein GspD [Kiritimatiellia bacterium]